MADYYAHPTAVIDDGAVIGAGTKVWHFCHVMGGATLGAQCILGQNVFVANGVEVGAGCKIQNNVSLYTGVVLEEDVFCGPSMVFTNVMNPRAHVERKDEYARTRVGRGASIGANATIVCGHDIGEYAFIGAGSVVTREVPAYALVFGSPAKVQGWMSAAGERLEFDESGRAICPRTGERYRLSDGRCAPERT